MRWGPRLSAGLLRGLLRGQTPMRLGSNTLQTGAGPATELGDASCSFVPSAGALLLRVLFCSWHAQG
eukprot:8055296-Alexandrium_andersonii.AAC.1